jgi:hypothetical protein
MEVQKNSRRFTEMHETGLRAVLERMRTGVNCAEQAWNGDAVTGA